jgi:hypothetical protein
VADRETVEVRYREDGTTKNDTFRCAGASVTMFRRGRAVVLLRDGSDDQGGVLSAQYERAYRIIRRPVGEAGRG